MKVHYLVEITNPLTHIVRVKLTAKRDKREKLTFFLPSWSPGSYLMREYSRHIRTLKVLSDNGEYIDFSQTTKSCYEVDFKNSKLNKECKEFTLEYEIYCHELTVRTSHVDESHAFLHGPSYLMGIKDESLEPTIEFRFPALWSKLHTGLKDISEVREKFLYEAESYDVLLDTPVEIGCHESDGFMHDGKEHHLVFYGDQFPHDNNLKADIKKIVETVSGHFSSIPYDDYLFITHFKKDLYGGLEHLNSTALHYDGRKLGSRKDYINWLALVAHEYFHTWNVKRIRPIELGPFDYLNENYTHMHWLTEGLTSFVDELFVLRSGLCTLEEYLEMQKNNLARYFKTPGKKFHSLEQSSFNAWIKLYRPDENSLNSSVSYYLKGGLVFSTLHFEFQKKGKSINDLLNLLWERYLANPEVGVTKIEVMDMIEDLAGRDVMEQFEMRLSTTEDIDFESYYKSLGMEFEWNESSAPSLDVNFKYIGDKVFIDNIILDGAAFRSGLNAGDEILAINNQRFLKADVEEMSKTLFANKKYKFTIARLNEVMHLDVLVGTASRELKKINIVDEAKARKAFLN